MRTLPQRQGFEQDDPATRRIVGCALEVHKRLGPGLLEKLCREAVLIKMEMCGLKAEKKVKIDVSLEASQTGIHVYLFTDRPPKKDALEVVGAIVKV